MEGPMRQRSNGTQAVVGALIAIVGALASANPDSVLLQALTDAVPQLASAVPTVITACGAIIAAFSNPPKLGRQRDAVSRQIGDRRGRVPVAFSFPSLLVMQPGAADIATGLSALCAIVACYAAERECYAACRFVN